MPRRLPAPDAVAVGLRSKNVRRRGLIRPTTVLVHQIAWTLGLGDLIEALGGKLAGRKAADDALAAGHNVLVFPGGDTDAAKSWPDRNRIKFDGRDQPKNLRLWRPVSSKPCSTDSTNSWQADFPDAGVLRVMLLRSRFHDPLRGGAGLQSSRWHSSQQLECATAHRRKCRRLSYR